MVTIWNSNGSVIIPQNPLQDSVFWKSSTGVTGSTNRGYSNSVEVGKRYSSGLIRFTGVKKDVAESFRLFILRDTDCGSLDFNIQGDSFDFGLGVGIAVNNCKIIDYSSTSDNALRTGTFLKYDLMLNYFYFDVAEQFHGLRKGAG